MRKETAVPVPGVWGLLRGIKGSVFYAFVLLTNDVAISGSFLNSTLFCPVWFLISFAKNAIERPGWGLALVRIGIPALTLAIVRANSDFQLGVAERNAQRIIVACEAYHADTGEFPEKLDELVPHYLDSVPVAKHCFGWNRFHYFSRTLFWYVVPPFGRKIYNFESRSWSYLD